MADPEAMQEATAGYELQAELERQAAYAKAKDLEYQTGESAAELKAALDAVVEQDLKNDYLTQRAVELNPKNREALMTEQQEPEQTNLDTLAATVAKLQAEKAPLPQRRTAQQELESALSAAAAAAAEAQKVEDASAEAEELEEFSQGWAEETSEGVAKWRSKKTALTPKYDSLYQLGGRKG